MTCIIVSLASILPASAQTPTQDDEYKTTLKKIMTLSGASATTDNILPQLMAMTKNSGLQKDEAYWMTLLEQRDTPKNDIAEQNRKRDQAMFDRAYTVPNDSVKVADGTYQRGDSTKPSIYSIERRKNETEVTFLQPIYYDWQWLHFGRGFKIVDKKSGDEYNVRGYSGIAT